MWKFCERTLNWNLFNCQSVLTFYDICSNMNMMMQHIITGLTFDILGSKAFKPFFNPTNIVNDEGGDDDDDDDDDDDEDDDVLHEQSLSAPTTFGGPGRLRITSFAS